MDLNEFITQVEGFARWSHPEKIKLFGWYLHVHEGREHFGAEQIRTCYDNLNFEPPNLSRDFARLADRTPAEILKDGQGYRLEARVRQALDEKYGDMQSTIVVTKLLSDLPSKVPGIEERAFLEEVIRCHKARAFRATTVMAWNLAFDHVLHWLLVDATRLATFNARIPVVYPKKRGFAISKFEDFEELKEREVIEVCNSASLISSGVFKIMKEKLDRRNTAGHPSKVEVLQYQAEDTIQDLVNNVVLKLT
ncbi:MAG TPA: hypothetical protein VGV12_08550 [Gemmatimonadales bacterium]|nr:hypothetical protein [Gemmatimonadales bacterium]